MVEHRVRFCRGPTVLHHQVGEDGTGDDRDADPDHRNRNTGRDQDGKRDAPRHPARDVNSATIRCGHQAAR